LALEEGFRMHPGDVDSLGLKNGDRIRLSFDNGKVSAGGAVRADVECPKGVIYYTRPVVFGGLKHRRELLPLYILKQNPIRVYVSRTGT
jgi:anaerobic selenocysteine-containing dehydrogenase